MTQPFFACQRLAGRLFSAVVGTAMAAAMVLGASSVVGGGAAAQTSFDTPAREAILIDYETGTVLFSKNADVLMPPASMSKIMTAYVTFERLQEGGLSLDDTFIVSEEAWRKGGSKMFVEVGREVRIEDLLRGVIVQSGNDASIVLAEGIAGTEAAFGELMTERARELGMSNSTFRNATGWPDPEHRTTARDLALLGGMLVQNFPEYYHFYSELEYTWNGIRQYNRNPLLRRMAGADGLKTGYTSESGYGLTASAERDGRRLVMVINGLDSADQRAQESQRLMEWGFREFENVRLFAEGETVEDAEVWLGRQASVPLVAAEDIVFTLPRRAQEDMVVTARYEGPIEAPIEAGQLLGTLSIEVPGMEPMETPLVAGAGVERRGLFGRLIGSLQYMIFGS